ncbi:MAG: hypothetical protein LBT16_11090 [Treponema sp.]|jgi:hypothetical protein|nr:hypothetical protein [Treponema sp.]
MAQTANENRQDYLEKIKPYQEEIARIQDKEKDILSHLSAFSEEAALQKLALADEMFNLTSCYMLENKIYQSIFNKQSEDMLNVSRKSLFKGIVYMEDIVTNLIDAPYSDYEDRVYALSGAGAEKVYSLVRKMGFTIDLLADEYGGDTSKWKWTFVDLEGRCAAVAKNVLDLRNILVNLDPRAPDYELTALYTRLVKKLLTQAAERFREKYEISSQRREDFLRGIDFLNALKRIHIILDERKEAEELKKTAEVWFQKLNKDMIKKKGAS